MTRRQPAIAFCASVRIWVPIWTGPTKRVTRNAKASTSPAVIRPPHSPNGGPEPDADDEHAGVGQPAEMPPSENEMTVKPCARVLAAL